jgi:hypothetical protein
MLKVYTVRQKFPPPARLDLAAELRRAFVPKVKPGARIAVGVGSRGVSNLAAVVREAVAILKDAGAQPFILPAMGSHGGATPEGQKGILEGYGVTEAAMGCPLRPSLEVERIGTSEDGVPVHWSVEALRSDGVLVINRIKPHTDFVGKVGSGILKMCAIGFGKQAGAAACHAAAQRLGLERVIKGVARVVLGKAPVLWGIGLLEDTHHQTARIVVVPRDEIESREAECQAEARRLMPRLPYDAIDLLVVDRLGKNITGAGMDPNVIGRSIHGYTSLLSDSSRTPDIKRILVCDMTPESHGNAIGLGMADFTTERLVRGMDRTSSYMNALTALSVQSIKIPITFADDREAIDRAIVTLALDDPGKARVVRIQDTLNLGTLQVSEACDRSRLEVLSGPEEFRFDPSGNLLPIGA